MSDTNVERAMKNLLDKWRHLAHGEDADRAWDPKTVCIELEFELQDAIEADRDERDRKQVDAVRAMVRNLRTTEDE